jgi:hypothetical protein
MVVLDLQINLAAAVVGMERLEQMQHQQLLEQAAQEQQFLQGE